MYDETARAFWEHGGFANQLGLLKFVLSRAGVKGLTVPKPEPSLDFGYYYPDGKSGQVFATWEEFDAWQQAHGKAKPRARPRDRGRVLSSRRTTPAKPSCSTR